MQLMIIIISIKGKAISSSTMKKSPASDAFIIYIANASDKGEMTEKWLAINHTMYIFYAAYSNMC